MKGVIIAGGRIEDNINKYIDTDTFVVCADSGYVYAVKNGIKTDVLIGDFDSIKKPINPACEVITHPVQKNATDTQLCIDYLSLKGIKDIILFGAFGGDRLDHSIANLQLLEYALNVNVHLKIIDGLTEVYMINSSSVTIYGEKGDIVSVFAVDAADGISYKGLKYPLKNASLSRSVPYCVSNAMIGNTAEIEVKKGKVIIVHIRGEQSER